MPRYAALYRDFFQTIGRPLTEKDGLNLEIRSANELAVPDAIADFFEVAGRADDFTLAYNRLLQPAEWINDGEMCAILEENQGVMLWGYRLEEGPLENPTVYQALAEDHEWQSLELPWSEFLLLMMCFQDVFGDEVMPFHDTALLTKELAQKIEETWTRVGQMDDWHAFIRPNCILCHLDWEGEPRLFIGAQNETLIEAVGVELDVELEGEMPW